MRLLCLVSKGRPGAQTATLHLGPGSKKPPFPPDTDWEREAALRPAIRRICPPCHRPRVGRGGGRHGSSHGRGGGGGFAGSSPDSSAATPVEQEKGRGSSLPPPPTGTPRSLARRAGRRRPAKGASGRGGCLRRSGGASFESGRPPGHWGAPPLRGRAARPPGAETFPASLLLLRPHPVLPGRGC